MIIRDYYRQYEIQDRNIKILQHLLTIGSKPIKSYANLVIASTRMAPQIIKCELQLFMT